MTSVESNIIPEPNPPTTLGAIKAIEDKHNIRFPRSYKAFLLRFNGGYPNRPLFNVPNRTVNPFDLVHYFLGIGVPEPVTELEYPLRLYAGGLPHGLVPIAYQPGGDMICLDIRKSGERIVLWDHAHFWSTGEWREQDIYHIADTFEEFLAGLKENPF